MILNALKNIEYKNHPLSTALVEETEVTLNMKTKNQNIVDTHSRLFALNINQFIGVLVVRIVW